MGFGSSIKRVLLIDGDAEGLRSIGEMMRQEGAQGFELEHVESVGEAERYLAGNGVDVILADMGVDGTMGGAKEEEIARVSKRVWTVLLLSREMEPAAKQAMQHGAQDYLIKGEFESRELVWALENAIERRLVEEAMLAEKACGCGDVSGEGGRVWGVLGFLRGGEEVFWWLGWS
jgi:DNA-binding NtrC family response regulator